MVEKWGVMFSIVLIIIDAESESNLSNQSSSAICSDTDLVFHSIYYDENSGKFMILPEDTSNATNSNESLGNSCDIPADIALLVSPSPSFDPAEIIISTVPTPPDQPQHPSTM
ncbi:cmgc cdk crk7 protein kinase [Lasius niger]|uniref:Cmgc cdk crk7 protein kinase n=1 Tax=Lasius niger TaxID=67767 RepID=A0A0J7MNT2_LASNI|nr:cmgc cdk crk7 protein kinase [Lasius niger]